MKSFAPRAALFAAALALIGARAALAQIAVPPLEARVTDQTGALDADQRAALEEKLRAFEARKGSQIAVLMVPSTESEDLADFGIRVAEAWKLGRKGIDDGAILLVARNDRRMRIEVGYGLEGVITDATSRRIIDETLAPRFRAGDFYGGIDAALDQMIRLIDGEPLPEPAPRWSGSPSIGDYLPILFFAIVVPALFLRRVLGRLGGSFASGALAAGIIWVLTKVIGLAIAVGLGAFALTMIFGGLGGPRRWSSHGRGGRGGWGGGFGGGGFGGGGGGGFGGGGGGFGGGGASGGW